MLLQTSLNLGTVLTPQKKIMLGLHSNTQQAPSAHCFQLPPLVKPLSFGSFLVEDFNKAPWVVSWAKDSPLFIYNTNLFRAVEPTKIGKNFSSCLYHLAKKYENPHIMCGTGVYHTDGLAPPLAEKPDNVYHRGFGSEFDLRP